jgi:coenzyme PQQ synthesis protein D (PqqD)
VLLTRPSPDVIGRRLDDRFVVVNLRTNHIYELNETASVLWELLEAHTDSAQLVPAIVERFDVEADAAQQDVDKTLRVLTDAGLVSA